MTQLRASTQVFLVPELVTIICDFVTRPNPNSITHSMLFNLALVNRLCSKIALDALWRRLNRLEPFLCLKRLYCASPVVSEHGSPPHRSFTDLNPATLIDLKNGAEAYSRYLLRVRSLFDANNDVNRGPDEIPVISEWSLDILTHSIPIGDLKKMAFVDQDFTLFPNLTELHLDQNLRSPHVSSIGTYFGSNLTTLNLTNTDGGSREDIDAMISILPVFYPNLKTLGLGLVGDETGLLASSLVPYIPQFSRLAKLQLTIDYDELSLLLKSHALSNLIFLVIIPIRPNKSDELTNLLQDLTMLFNTNTLLYLSSLRIQASNSILDSQPPPGPSYQIFESFLRSATSETRQTTLKNLELYTDLDFNYSDEQLAMIGKILGKSIETLVLSPIQ